MKFSVNALLQIASVALVAGQNCNLLVPPAPLTAKGLGTAYILSTTTAANGLAATSGTSCSVLSPAGSVFAESLILDTSTGKITFYALTVADSTSATAVGGLAAPIVPPTLPVNNVVGIWFGGNNAYTTLTEATAGTALIPGFCVNGLSAGAGTAPAAGSTTPSQFGEFAYCNAPAFFNAANFLISQGLITVPPVGVTTKGAPCPTVRSFSMVDQDQSDNSLSSYLLTITGQVAQSTAANIGNLNVIQNLVNPSDNRLVAGNVLPAVGCTPFMVPDNIDGAIDPNNPTLVPIMRSAMGLNELSAAASGNPNPALVPSYHPMTLISATAQTAALNGPLSGNTPVGQPSLAKINAYRQGVNQPPLSALNSPADMVAYCTSMLAETGPFLALHGVDLSRAPSLIPKVASNLLALLVARFGATYGIFGCAALTGEPNPMVALDALGNPAGNLPAVTTNVALLYPAQAKLGGFA